MGRRQTLPGTQILLRTLPRLVFGLLVVALAVHYATFDDFALPPGEQVKQASAAVVFTGAYSRIDAGLQLLSQDRVPRLYITGFNAKSGIFPNFTEMYTKRNPDIASVGDLMACCAEVGVEARSTYQNALETRCWIEKRNIEGPILLITSRNHMARALADLQGKLPLRRIIPYPVFDIPPTTGRNRMAIFLQYLASLVASRLPLQLDPRDAGAFTKGCPNGSSRMIDDWEHLRFDR